MKFFKNKNHSATNDTHNEPLLFNSSLQRTLYDINDVVNYISEELWMYTKICDVCNDSSIIVIPALCETENDETIINKYLNQKNSHKCLKTEKDCLNFLNEYDENVTKYGESEWCLIYY